MNLGKLLPTMRLSGLANYFESKAVHRFFYCCLVVLTVGYVVVAVHTPMTLYPGAPHDDGLYMTLGRHLSEGRWLGPFSQFTLMKGPGYPAFLGVASYLGISISLAHALFHCLAIGLFVLVIHRFIASEVISGLLYLLLLWHPVTLSTYFLRVLREEIYYGQVLIVFALSAVVLFYPSRMKHRVLLACLCGVVLGWYWLTREEGPWILPGIGVMICAALAFAFWEKRVVDLVVPLVVLVGVFGCTQLAFRAVNLVAYGKFVGIDVKESNFLATLQALHGVRAGGTRPFISVTRAAREKIYAVSPAFASLKSYFEGPSGSGWSFYNCSLIPVSCGDIGSGWFMWALRDAAASLGYYASPAKASAFFRQLAAEINDASKRGELECAPQFFPEIAPVTWAQLAEHIPPRYVNVFDMLMLPRPPLQINPSSGPDELLAASLRFLNYPLHTPPSDSLLGAPTFTLNGWYLRSGREWFSVSARMPDGLPAEVQVQRIASPDIQEGFKDPDASQQRFFLRTRCVEQCIMTFQTATGAKVEQSLAELQRGLVGFDFEKTAHLVVESAAMWPNPAYVKTPFDEICRRVREAILTNYRFLSLPIYVLGAIAFAMASIIYMRRMMGNVCYVLALASWLLVFARASLLVLIDATTFPALFPFYLAPAYFLLISASVLSLAAWLQLSGRLAEPYPIRGGERRSWEPQPQREDAAAITTNFRHGDDRRHWSRLLKQFESWAQQNRARSGRNRFEG